MNYRSFEKLVFLFLCTSICTLLLSSCGSSKESPIDADVALECMWKLQEYVEQTGDTDIYLYLLEGMDREYLDAYVIDVYSSDFDSTYKEGQADGYTEGFEDGSRLIIDYMDEDYREKWWNENIDMITEYKIEY